jgi:predicted 2-oxoglutarate/Fe(II)-dependent dioxygenase YbiX
MNLYWKAIYKYVLEDIKNSWFDSWSGFSKIRYNKYSSNKKMAEHCDHITMIFDGERKGIPILSVLSVLNNDYSGGEFFMFQDKKIKLNEGDVLIFPSNFLYPHKVDPVIKGTRYSMISWVW